MAEERRTLVDSMKELRQTMKGEHDQSLVVQANHLCMGSMRDVAVVIGALGLGLWLGRYGAFALSGKWRLLPFVVGGSALAAARFVPSERMRFVTRASTVVSGSALMLSMVHFTLQSNLEEATTMEA